MKNTRMKINHHLSENILLLFFLIFCCLSSAAQTFHEEVQATFNFEPRNLKKEEQEKLFPKLDKFFEKVIQNKTTYIQPLREELKRSDNNPYFYYDGGILLMEINKEKEDLQLVADALVKSDLRDLPPALYLNHLLRLSKSGADVIDATLHILDDTTFQVFIPQHAMSLDIGGSLKFLLPRYDSDSYVNKLIERYNNTNSIIIKKAILESLFYSCNCTADEKLVEVRNSNKEPKEVIKLAKQYSEIDIPKRKDSKEKYANSKEKIKSCLVRISDEAAGELFDLTLQLKSFYTCKN